jgi:bacterioferritin (cytochrome b1)
MGHATLLGEKIVALGGEPVVKILEIHENKGQSIAEMLAEDLKSEREAMEGYAKILPLVADDVALTSMLTRMVEEETQHLEEIEKMVRGL